MAWVRVLFAWFSFSFNIVLWPNWWSFFWVSFVSPNETFIFPIFGEMRLWAWEIVAVATLIASIIFYRLGRQKILTYYLIASLFSSLLSIISQLPALTN